MWSPYEFHLVNILRKGQDWTSQYYIYHILPEIGALRNAKINKKSVVHAGNAKPHVANRAKQ
jgi:hypothetical protein